jgi:UDP-N-acetylmuramate dehydrogenase
MHNLRVAENFNLQSLNTFGIQARARYYTQVTGLNELRAALAFAKSKDKGFHILGGGSNMVFMQDYNGLIIHNKIHGVRIIYEDEKKIHIKAGAGVVWHDLVLHCIDKGWGGIENLSLIPGYVGAAPIQNIGAYGVEIKDVLLEVEYYHVESDSVETVENKACRFGYRDSIFKQELKHKTVILNVTIKLSKQPELNISYGAIDATLKEMGISNPTPKDVSNAVIKIRKAKLPDPVKTGNAGSFFKNPVVSKAVFENLYDKNPKMPYYNIGEDAFKIPAAWLIDTCGWKGKSEGNAGVHQNQPLVLINLGNVTGKEVYDLSEKIRQSVYQQFGINLQREVNLV